LPFLLRRLRSRFWQRQLCLPILLLALVGWVSWLRTPAWIVPPTQLSQPVTVYVVDYGFHACLVLPAAGDGLVQFTYGDWTYFARDRQTLPNGFKALFWPTTGALGRKWLSGSAALKRRWEQDVRLLAVEVAGADAAQLLRSLNARFERQRRTSTYNRKRDVYFVPDEAGYALWHNSNHEVAAWLRALGCRVEGPSTFPPFRLRSRAPDASR